MERKPEVNHIPEAKGKLCFKKEKGMAITGRCYSELNDYRSHEAIRRPLGNQGELLLRSNGGSSGLETER